MTYISFNEWLETKVKDAKNILPQARIAFMQLYLQEKENGTLPKSDFPNEFEEWLKDKVLDTNNLLPEAKKAFFDLYKKETEKQPQLIPNKENKSSNSKQVPEDLSQLTPKQFLDKDGKIDIDFALRVAQKASTQSK